MFGTVLYVDGCVFAIVDPNTHTLSLPTFNLPPRVEESEEVLFPGVFDRPRRDYEIALEEYGFREGVIRLLTHYDTDIFYSYDLNNMKTPWLTTKVDSRDVVINSNVEHLWIRFDDARLSTELRDMLTSVQDYDDEWRPDHDWY